MTLADFNSKLSDYIPGFEFLSDRWEWRQKEANRVLRIFISYDNYSPGYFKWSGMGGGIIFSEIEDILTPILKKYDINTLYHDNTVKIVYKNISEIDKTVFMQPITDDDSFSSVAIEIKKLVDEGAFPFLQSTALWN